MVILNSLKLLQELTEIEEKINKIKSLCDSEDIVIDEEKILRSILNQKTRPFK